MTCGEQPRVERDVRLGHGVQRILLGAGTAALRELATPLRVANQCLYDGLQGATVIGRHVGRGVAPNLTQARNVAEHEGAARSGCLERREAERLVARRVRED